MSGEHISVPLRATKATTHPITAAAQGSVVTVSHLAGGWDFRKRLTARGVIKNVLVRVIKNTGAGPLLLEVNGTRLAVGRGEAEKIVVFNGAASAGSEK